MYRPHTVCRACGWGSTLGPGGIKSVPGKDKLIPVLDLGVQPLANDFSKDGEERAGYAPLKVLLCPRCNLAQLSATVRPDILYGHYCYVTNHTPMMMDHFASLWAELVKERPIASVAEIGSNDGTFLKFCLDQKVDRVMGIEPAENLVKTARDQGINTLHSLFDAPTARMASTSFPAPALIIARHVFCHIDNWQEFVANIAAMCEKETLVAIEIPYVMDMLEKGSFDQCLPPGQLIVTERGMVEIENVTLADRVLTHCGTFRKVSHVFQNPYAGEVVSVMAYGQNIPLLLTPNHPVLVLRDGQMQFVEAAKLKAGDRLVKPCCDIKGTTPTVTATETKGNSKTPQHRSFDVNEDLCKIFGFYLAEGFYYECKPGAAQVSFAFGKSKSEKTLAEECARALRRNSSKANLNLTKYGWRVTTYGAMARLLKKSFGSGAINKQLPGWSFSLPRKLVEVLVESYIRGDGYSYRDGKYWRASTVSLKLAQGIAVLANRIGHPCSINVGKVLSPRKIASNPNISVLTNPPIDILIRRNQSKKIKTSCDGIRQFSLVRSVCTAPYSGPVFNLEVEDHHSYTTIQSAVHNCYHEHLSYLNVKAIQYLLDGSAMRLHKVLRFPIHGGVVVLLLRRRDSEAPTDPSVNEITGTERCGLEEWAKFESRARDQICSLRTYVTDLSKSGKKVCGHGASAKATVWINACGFTKKEISYVMDSTRWKVGSTVPGTDIPIVHEGTHIYDCADYSVIFCWNFLDHILKIEKQFIELGGKLIVPIPEIKVLP